MADESIFGPPADEQPQAGIWAPPDPDLDLMDESLFPVSPPEDPVVEADAEFIDYTVEFGGRTFEIGEPDLATVLELVNAIGDIMLHAEKHLATRLGNLFTAIIGGKVQSSQPFEATIFGLMATIKIQHFIRIAAIVLFGGKDHQKKEAETFFRTIPEDQIKIAPVVRALALRIHQSEDLAESLGNFSLAQTAISVWASKRDRGRGKRQNGATPAS